MTATSSTACSACSSGGRKTRTWPSRTSTASAVGGASWRSTTVGRRPAASPWAGRSPRARTATARSRRQRRPGERVERQAQADRRVAGDQVQPASAEVPAGRAPPVAAGRRVQRQHEPGRARPTGPSSRSIRSRRGRRGRRAVGSSASTSTVGRLARGQPGLAPDLVDRVLVGGDDTRSGRARSVRRRRRRSARASSTVAGPGLDGSASRSRSSPQRLAVAAPDDADLPARQRFARVPLALAVLDQAAGGEPVVRAARARSSARVALGRRRRRRCSTRRLPCRRSTRTSARRPSSAGRRRPRAARRRASPSASMRSHCSGVYGSVTRGSSRTRCTTLRNSNSTSVGSVRPGDRGGGRRVRRAGQRDVALAGEQPRRRVEADPSGTGHVDLGPGVEVGEVGAGPVGAVERRLVGR